MKLTIRSTNFTLTPALRVYIDQKLNRDISRFLSGVKYPAQIWVEVGKSTRHHKKGSIFRAEAQIDLPGAKAIRGVSEHVDLRLAIDEVKDELQGQLKRYKGKQETKYKRGARKAKKDIRLSKGARFFRKGRILDEGI